MTTARFVSIAVGAVLLTAARGNAAGICEGDATRLPHESTSVIPYELDRRPSPEGLALAEILPPEIGPFSRGPLDMSDLPHDGDLNVDYRLGSYVITIGLVVAASAAQARCLVGGAQRATGTGSGGETPSRTATLAVARIRASRSGDFLFFKTGDFMAWSRGHFFFYVKADSPRTLDLFMVQFAK